jgi:hypothetical protein
MSTTLFAEELSQIGIQQGKPIKVTLSNDLVRLLSTQLYRSPLKAIEELVVNSYDAGAKECRVFTPAPSDQERRFVVVWDNGAGMDYEGLQNLWQIGRSVKRTDDVERRFQRKQIGKFGIGKLATYTIAERLTYLTRTGKTILAVSIDYSRFTDESEPLPLVVTKIDDWDRLRTDKPLGDATAAAGIKIEKLLAVRSQSWTLALLEKLKAAAGDIRIGRLGRVLSTAMPLSSDFKLYLNDGEIKSAKEDVTRVVEFSVTDLPKERLEALKNSTGEEWRVDGNRLVSSSFPSGVSGTAFTTVETLGGKSEDLMRSHGFFVRVLGRLIDEADPLFGLSPKSYKYFNRFRAEINADDLDRVITAPRESIEESRQKKQFQAVLNEVFNEARQRHDQREEELDAENRRQKETNRNYVNPRLVERPVADVIATFGEQPGATEADERWFYLDVEGISNKQDLIRRLYQEGWQSESRQTYTYLYSGLGDSRRLVRFSPETSTFTINQDHDFVREHYEDGKSRRLLEDFVTAEALLEIYLRENGVAGHVVGEVLERRDVLLRSLAYDRPYSLGGIAQSIRDATADQYDLEIALVAAARALGFVATHVSGEGEPDGVARFRDYANGEAKIILEAKSSGKVPSLSAIDFGGLDQHLRDHAAQACLLVAPSYPGGSRGASSAAAKRAKNLKISCWTVDQLANVVEQAEARHFTARDVLDIVLTRFAPEDVASAVDDLMADRRYSGRDLYRDVLEDLRQMDGFAANSVRTVGMLLGRFMGRPGFEDIDEKAVAKAVQELAHASQGAITIAGDRIVLHTSLEEIERRVSGLTGEPGAPRRPSTFRR